MPNYSFLDELTGFAEDVFFKFSDAPSIGSYIEYEGRKLRRLATCLQIASDTVNIDPHSQADFIKATNKAGTIGDMWKLSEELSKKREDQYGKDPVKEKHLDEQQAKTGRVPLERKRLQAKEKLAKKGIIIEK